MRKVGIRNDDMVHPHNTSDEKIKSDEPHLTSHVHNADSYIRKEKSDDNW